MKPSTRTHGACVTLAALAVALLIAGCGRREPADKPADAPGGADKQAGGEKKAQANAKGEPKPDREEPKGSGDTAGGFGALKGKVVYDPEAKLPANPEVQVTNDKAFCEKGGKIHRNEWVVDAKTRGVKNVIVWLTPVEAKDAEIDWDEKNTHPKLKEAPKQYEADQPVCAFTPRIIALREGTELVFKNSAEVSHNVSMEGGDLGPRINTAIPPGKELPVGKVKARPLPFEYKCTIHPWMKGWVASFKHPYFAVTDEKGEFEIKDAPAGRWRLQVWHEVYGFVQKGKRPNRERGIVVEVKDRQTTVVPVPPLVSDD